MRENLEDVVSRVIRHLERRHYGKYRGIVVDNADPERLGRLKLKVPSIFGTEVVTGWALPCLPYGGRAGTGLFFIPEKESGVWVEFEEGDLEFPVWSGIFFSKPEGELETPRPNDSEGKEVDGAQDPPTRKIIKTAKGHTLQFEDKEGEEAIAIITVVKDDKRHVVTFDNEGITLTEANGGHSVVLDGEGIRIVDAANSHEITLNGDGITIQSSDMVVVQNRVQLGAGGEAMALGDTLNNLLKGMVQDLMQHTHVGNMGAPTSPPTPPILIQTNVDLQSGSILSRKHTLD